MGKLQLLLVLINIIVLTSCTESEGSSASAIASVKTTVTKTTTVPKDSSDNGSSGTNNSNCEFDCDKCAGALERVKRAIIKFTFKYLYEIIESSKSNTMIGSPLTTFYYAAYFILFTYGKTYEELLKFTNLKNKEEAICIMKEINTYTQNQPDGIEHRFGVNVVADYSDNFTEPFKRGMIELVEGRGLNFDFDEPNKVRKMVNKVIAEQTNNRVKKAITPSYIFKKDNYASKLVFASGEFFRGKWQKEFNKKNITQGNYCDAQNNILQVPFLNQCGIYKYKQCTKLGVQVVSIPFVDGFYDCVLFLPKRACDLKSLVMKLQNPDVFNSLICDLKPKKVNLCLPVYSNAASEIDNVKVLKAMNINSLFDSKMADIKNAYGTKTDEYVSDGRQSLIIKNVLAGAKPYIGDECSCDIEDQNEYDFIADHPVVYSIMSNGVPQIVAVGKVIT